MEPFVGEWLPQTVSQIEQGRRRLDTTELLALGFVLEVPPSWFFTPDEPRISLTFPAGEERPYSQYLISGAEDVEQLPVATTILQDTIGTAIEDATKLLRRLERAGGAAQLLREVVDPPDARGRRLRRKAEIVRAQREAEAEAPRDHT